nr:YggS family pyridoxal phosphate-dependent enzyme [Kineococcus siccus]
MRAVRERVDAAARAAGRDPRELTLVAVTKFFPAADVRTLAALGVTDVGESRDQEAATKAEQVAAAGVGGLRWHFVGQLQSNKARSVAGYADVVHSVDRAKVAVALDRGAGEHGRRTGCFVQVDLAPALGAGVDAGRGGAEPGALPAVTAAVAGSEWLDLLGLMAVAPREVEPERAFAALAGLAADVRREHPGAVLLSAGMSGDLEQAVAAGATHLRVGGAILGPRPVPR